VHRLVDVVGDQQHRDAVGTGHPQQGPAASGA
jgi:hypothetical protein